MVCVHQPLVGGDEEAAGAAGRVADRELRLAARVGLHAADDGLDQDARREVLPGALLALAGRLLQQPSKPAALTSTSSAVHSVSSIRPMSCLEVDRVVEARLGPAKMSPSMPGCLAELAEDVDVVIGQVGAGS